MNSANKGSKLWDIDKSAARNLENCLRRLGAALDRCGRPSEADNPFVAPWYKRTGLVHTGFDTYSESVSSACASSLM